MTKRDVVFENRQGKRIQATLRSVAGKSKGTIILLHGLGGWKEQPLLVIVADALCNKGYTVFSFDAADGAKGPDADFFHSTTTGYVEDLDDVVTYVTNAEWYSGPLILAGHSMGGMASIRYARLHPSRISKLILMAPAVSWSSGLAFSLLPGLWWLAFNKYKTPGPHHSKLLLDRGWLLDFMKFNSKRDAPYIAVPTLIVSGTKDTTVTSASLYSLGHWFPNATNTVISEANHIFWKHERKLADTITAWLTSS